MGKDPEAVTDSSEGGSHTNCEAQAWLPSHWATSSLLVPLACLTLHGPNIKPKELHFA